MSSNVKRMPVTVGGLLVAAFILFVVSNALPSWSTIGIDSSTATTGLWKACASDGTTQVCSDISCSGTEGDAKSVCSKILAGRAFLTLACITSAISAVCLFLSVFTDDKIREILLMGGKGLAFISLFMGLIGVAVGIVGTTGGAGVGSGIKLGAGSIIGIIALIVNLFGAIGSVLIK